MKDSDSDGEVDQSDLSELTHRRQASSGPSNGRRHLDGTNSGTSGRNRKETVSRNWADSERPTRARELEETTDRKVKDGERFDANFCFIVAPCHASRNYSIAQMFLESR